MYTAKIAIDKLEIDLPVSEMNVQQKVESMKTHGLIQPVTIWLGGEHPMIIDGFHRVEAAKRLGWKEIDANQVDCSEEAFWDARIQSAKQHHDIEKERLSAWMANCWEHSALAAQVYQIPLTDLANALWNVSLEDCRIKPRTYYFEHLSRVDKDNLSGKALEIWNWIDERAKKWGVSLDILSETILFQFYIHKDFSSVSAINGAALLEGLSLSERQQLEKLIDRQPRDQWEVSAFLKNGKPGQAFSDYQRQLKQEEEEKETKQRRIALEAEVAAAQEELEFSRNTEEGRKRKQANIRREIMARYDWLIVYIERNEEWIKTMPDGAELLAEFGLLARDTINHLWPSINVERYEVPSQLEKLGELRRELEKEHTLRIHAEAAVLKRQERAKKLQERLDNVIAWSSRD